MGTKKYSSGNGLIKAAVIIGDFIILNTLLYLSAHYIHKIIPIYPQFFWQEPRITFTMANVSMIIGQFCIGSIIHHRRTTFDEVFLSVVKLCLLQTTVMFFCLRMIGESGGMFRYMVLFAIVEIIAIMCSRVVEKLLIKWFRQSGRNTRSVLFVGNDPAIHPLHFESVKFFIATSTPKQQHTLAMQGIWLLAPAIPEALPATTQADAAGVQKRLTPDGIVILKNETTYSVLGTPIK